MNRSDDLGYWLQLVLTEGIGPHTAHALLGYFGLPEQIFCAGLSALQKRVPEKLALALSRAPTDRMQAQIDKTLAWCAQPGNFVFTLADAAYPQALLRIPDPPALIYAKGNIALLNRPAIAIVGSRNATVQGLQNAERFAQTLSEAGFTVVSGLALGIDAAAHRGALKVPAPPGCGSTVGIIGTGLDLVYPARHRALAHQLAEQGCLMSEYPLGTPAIASNFPRRNRLISGLSLGVLVVEAAAQSGSLITARTALEQDRDVFAIPGSIHSPLSKGCHELIRQGARLVESAHDILEELRWESPQAATLTAQPAALGTPPDPSSDDAPDRVLAALGHDPASFDQLAERTALALPAVQTALLQLEMNNQIELLAGGRYRRLD